MPFNYSVKKPRTLTQRLITNMNDDYKCGLMEGHNEDDNNITDNDFDLYDENIEWDEWE